MNRHTRICICIMEFLNGVSFYFPTSPTFATYHLRFVDTVEPRGSEGSGGQWRQEPVTINEMLLRGCILRNTSWVIALVAFTGSDTKIMLNGGSTPSKVSFPLIIPVLTLGLTFVSFSGVKSSVKPTSTS